MAAAPERLTETTPARADWFWPLIYTCALHAILFALLFVSFAFVPEIPNAQPVIQATVYQLKAERPKSQAAPDKIVAEAEKTKAPEREDERLEQQKQQREAEEQRKAQQAKQAAEKQAAEQARLAEAAKQAEALKQAEEQAKQVAEAAKQQAAEAKRLEAEQKQREADAVKKRAAEQARQKAEAEAKRLEAEKKQREAKAAEAKRQAEIAARQKREAEEKRKREVEAEKRRAAAAEATRKTEAEARRKHEAEEAKRRADEERKAKARADLIAAEVERRKAQGESQRKQLIASLDDLFVRLVSEKWIRPENTRNGISSEIQVSMRPDGTITGVVLVRSSGDMYFDNSALAAIRSVRRISEMQKLDAASFDARYRKRNLIFNPEDLER